jgi:hypothetical protein
MSAHLDVELILLQGELMDYTGHVRYGLTRKRALRIVDEIQRVRSELDFPALDMSGRWRRRADVNRRARTLLNSGEPACELVEAKEK